MEQIALLGHLTLHCKIVLISVSLRLDHCIVINRWSSRSSYLKKKKKVLKILILKPLRALLITYINHCLKLILGFYNCLSPTFFVSFNELLILKTELSIPHCSLSIKAG